MTSVAERGVSPKIREFVFRSPDELVTAAITLPEILHPSAFDATFHAPHFSERTEGLGAMSVVPGMRLRLRYPNFSIEPGHFELMGDALDLRAYSNEVISSKEAIRKGGKPEIIELTADQQASGGIRPGREGYRAFLEEELPTLGDTYHLHSAVLRLTLGAIYGDSGSIIFGHHGDDYSVRVDTKASPLDPGQRAVEALNQWMAQISSL